MTLVAGLAPITTYICTHHIIIEYMNESISNLLTVHLNYLFNLYLNENLSPGFLVNQSLFKGKEAGSWDYLLDRKPVSDKIYNIHAHAYNNISLHYI